MDISSGNNLPWSIPDSSLVRLVLGLDGLGGRDRLVIALGHHRHLRGRVLGGHRDGQVGALRLVAVHAGRVGDGVGVAVVVGVAVLSLTGVARLAAVVGHGPARVRGRNAILRLVAVMKKVRRVRKNREWRNSTQSFI